MNSLESVRKLLEDYLEETSSHDELNKMLLILGKEDFPQRVYDAFFNLIADPTQTPGGIVHLLDTYTSGLGGFSTNRPIQNLIAFACLEALARRRPKVLNGPWEKLVWIIVKYSSFAITTQGNALSTFKTTNIETIDWITKFGSQKLCPNPCLRLELFRFIRSFNCNDFHKYAITTLNQKSLRDNVIITLFELCDNYTSLTIDQVPNFSPLDLQLVIEDNNISMGYIMNDYELHLKKSEIITAVLKLTSIFALLEKEKHQIFNNQAIDHESLHVNIETQLSACLSFCGLIPSIPDDYDDCMLYFIQAVGNNPLLLDFVIDTLDTITKVSLCFPDEDGLQDTVIHIKGRILNRFFKSHIKKLPKHQYLQEIYGGNTPATEYRLRYFQNNMVEQRKDSDNDSDSDENEYRQHYISEMVPLSEEDMSDEDDISAE